MMKTIQDQDDYCCRLKRHEYLEIKQKKNTVQDQEPFIFP